MPAKSIYIAATGQHVGKTTSTLGLADAFKNMGLKTGYCKPVGQQSLDFHHLKVDKDVFLFSDLLGFNIDPPVHSPVILDKGATSLYLDNPGGYDLESNILRAAGALGDQYELVIHEGTGHPGVGSVAALSNADVAHLVGARVVMVVEGGIGNTIDRLSLSIPIFEKWGVPIIGVIVNKVFPEKLDKVTYYLSKKLKEMNLPLLGVLPYDKSLAYPTMEIVAEAIKGVVVCNEDHCDNKVEDIIAGSLVEVEELKNFQNLLLVVSSQRVNEAIQKIEYISRMLRIENSPLSGVVATGPGLIEGACVEYLQTHKIPLVRTSLDTYGSVLKISRIEVKINRSTPWKVKRAIELIQENVNMEAILRGIDL